jgi:NAD(P)H-dependent flavin oxidoreductase YrpB (nitropropane dioxygenase family)
VIEVASALHELGLGDPRLIEAGGIVGERGWAAAFALEASGIAMGTQSLGADETSILDSSEVQDLGHLMEGWQDREF